MSSEEDYKKELAANGVDLPEIKEEQKEEIPEEPAKVEPEKEEAEDSDHLQDPKEQRKRSIYDEYKDKKSELKSEKEKREQAERERDELRTKLDAVSEAETPEERKEAQDELDVFAKEINADPAALKRMRDLFLKGQKPDETISKDLAEFKAWKSQNSQMLEAQMFDKEFQSVSPTIKTMFPSISEDEMTAVRQQLDKLSHSKEWHDKDLDYVVFKNKEVLAPLVSPKKRGMEGQSRREADEETFEFDPNVDYTSLTPTQREQWEAEYRKATSSKDVITDSKGRKLII